MSRIAIISDIHGNIHALEAVWNDIQMMQCTEVYCLGDIVGYNANPAECIDFLNDPAKTIIQKPFIRGNHDQEAIGCDVPSYMNRYALASLLWTRNQLKDEHKKLLRRSPFQRILPNGIVLVHATLDKPNSWGYVMDIGTANHCLNQLTGNQFLCLCGHTHVPRIFIKHENGAVVEYQVDNFPLSPGCQYLINVGSVGQGRHGKIVLRDDAGQLNEYVCASYGIIDVDNSYYYHRYVPYDVDAAHHAILNSDLDKETADFLARRLINGV